LLSLVFFHYAETAPAQSPTQILQKKARNRWNLAYRFDDLPVGASGYYVSKKEGDPPCQN
jgi:hypothetical protein